MSELLEEEIKTSAGAIDTPLNKQKVDPEICSPTAELPHLKK